MEKLATPSMAAQVPAPVPGFPANSHGSSSSPSVSTQEALSTSWPGFRHPEGVPPMVTN